ncbi:MAG: KTSC domain-containing protein [Methanoregula sp.]|nr:KTSC domain-containing protein [Methanoregula sp.]
MERQPVQSCILRSVGYDDSMKNMEIEFHSGLVYQYSGVPTKVYTDLMSSSAVGKFFSDKIRNRFRAKQIPV